MMHGVDGISQEAREELGILQIKEKLPFTPGEDYAYFDCTRAETANGVNCVLRSLADLLKRDNSGKDWDIERFLDENCSDTSFKLEYFDRYSDRECDYFLTSQFTTTLHHLLKQKKHLPEQTALKLYYDLLRTLTHLQQADVLHRDLNPKSIFLIEDPSTQEYKVRIANFGYALRECTGSGIAASEAEYVSPVVISCEVTMESGRVGYGAEVDYWAATVVLYEMLFGCKPFNLESLGGWKESLEFMRKFSGENLRIPANHHVSAGTIAFLKKNLNVKVAAELGDELLDDDIFLQFGAEHRTPLTQSMINNFENHSILFNSLRQSKLIKTSWMDDKTQAFIGKLNRAIGNEKVKIGLVNKIILMANEYLSTFKLEPKKHLTTHIQRIVAMIICLRALTYYSLQDMKSAYDIDKSSADKTSFTAAKRILLDSKEFTIRELQFTEEFWRDLKQREAVHFRRELINLNTDLDALLEDIKRSREVYANEREYNLKQIFSDPLIHKLMSSMQVHRDTFKNYLHTMLDIVCRDLASNINRLGPKGKDKAYSLLDYLFYFKSGIDDRPPDFSLREKICPRKVKSDSSVAEISWMKVQQRLNKHSRNDQMMLIKYIKGRPMYTNIHQCIVLILVLSIISILLYTVFGWKVNKKF